MAKCIRLRFLHRGLNTLRDWVEQRGFFSRRKFTVAYGLFDDGTVRFAVTFCNPDDTFSKREGRKYAESRLFETGLVENDVNCGPFIIPIPEFPRTIRKVQEGDPVILISTSKGNQFFRDEKDNNPLNSFADEMYFFVMKDLAETIQT